MKNNRLLFLVCLLLACTPARAQVTTWAQGFDKSVNAASARAYLGLGTNGGTGVSSFSADPLAGLFNVSVLTPTTTPHLQFSFQSQSANLVFASPDGAPGTPSFRALTLADLPPIPTGGSVTNFRSGDLSPLFTTSVATPTSWPTLSYTLTSQGQNAVFAGPASGSGLPTFRTLVAGDIPTLSQYVITITNADSATTPPDISLITSSNPPAPSLKGLRAGGNVSLTDNGTSITISAANSGGGASGIDLSQTNMPAFDGATNFYVDFNYPAQVLTATGAIYFNYATNWGLANTSRVANVFFPATNYFRHVYFINAATNWSELVRPFYGIPTGYSAKVQFQIFGQGDTNVAYTPYISDTPVTTNYLTVNGFNPTNSQGGCVLWLEASTGTYQEEVGLTKAVPGTPVRWWSDLSNFVPRLTNNAGNQYVTLTTPNTTPGNVPSLHWSAGSSWFVSPTFANLAQPNWAFVMWYGRGNSFTWIDGLSEGNRFGVVLGEGISNPCQIYSGTTLSLPSAPTIGWRLLAFCQNSTTSIIRTNGVLGITGNSGTQTPSRWAIGSDYNQATFTADAYAAEVLIYHSNLTLVQITNVENYFMAKYGSSLGRDSK